MLFLAGRNARSAPTLLILRNYKRIRELRKVCGVAVDTRLGHNTHCKEALLGISPKLKRSDFNHKRAEITWIVYRTSCRRNVRDFTDRVWEKAHYCPAVTGLEGLNRVQGSFTKSHFGNSLQSHSNRVLLPH